MKTLTALLTTFVVALSLSSHQARAEWIGALAGSNDRPSAECESVTPASESDELLALTTTANTYAGRACRDSRDCMPATEHCVRGVCELRSRPCYSNFDCQFPEVCRRGTCGMP